MSNVFERPPGGPASSRSGTIVLALAGAGLGLVAIRLLAGLGAVSAMTDGYAWGIWKALNAVVFTGVGAGALALSLVTYVGKGGRHHPIARSAALVGAIAYTLAGFSTLVDLGRWWNAWALFAPATWNLHSVLLEVALCAVAYCAVLWIEILPALLERWRAGAGRLAERAGRVSPLLQRGFPLVAALAIVLPIMHQSSLGSLLLVGGTKLHPLWHTPWLPALFLLSCLSMGVGAVIVVDTLAHVAGRRARDEALPSTLALLLAGLAFAFAALRVADVLWAGELPLVRGSKGLLFVVELALFLYPAVRLLAPSYRRNPGYRFWAAQLAVAAGALYRLDAYLAAFDAGPGWSYFPSVGELLLSVVLVSLGLVGYLAAVKRLPVLPGGRAVGAPSTRRGAA